MEVKQEFPDYDKIRAELNITLEDILEAIESAPPFLMGFLYARAFEFEQPE